MNRIQNRCAALLAGLTLAGAAGQARPGGPGQWPQRPVRGGAHGPGSPDILAPRQRARDDRLGQAFIGEPPWRRRQLGTEYASARRADLPLRSTRPGLQHHPSTRTCATTRSGRAGAGDAGRDCPTPAPRPTAWAWTGQRWLDARAARLPGNNFASTGNGSISHLGVELLKLKTVRGAHPVRRPRRSRLCCRATHRRLPGAIGDAAGQGGKLKVHHRRPSARRCCLRCSRSRSRACPTGRALVRLLWRCRNAAGHRPAFEPGPRPKARADRETQGPVLT